MKEKALQVASQQENEQQKINHLREYLQHLILREMFELDWLSELVFHGGTGLRILYDLNRFSEDLDFHLSHSTKNYSINQKLDEIKARLEKNGYKVQISSSSEKNVKNPIIKFAGGLLYEAGITPHEHQKLNIKIEIDTNPPMGFRTDTTLMNEYFPLALNHLDKSSFIAGKCHAILQREWTKGRDFFDLLFYLNRWEGIEPNLIYLNNALEQTGFEETRITQENWRETLLEKVKEVSWSTVEEDVKPFLLNKEDLAIFSKKFLIEELSN
ncbi:MAG: nucleotidyl transferase AbiEii/AbiGii toxin family protein [Candidatus Bipolaricaulia bacterium]